MELVRTGMPAIAAHRGWHQDGASHNGIAALEAAVAGGADKVELDVRRLGDGTIVVHHDAVLPDGRSLSSVDASVLREHPDLPTLDAWSRRAGELGATALTELKEAGYEREVHETLSRHLPARQIEYFSFQPDAVRALHELAPDRPVGMLSDVQLHGFDAERIVREAHAHGATFVGLNVRQSTDAMLQAAADARLGVAIWTVDQPDDLARLLGDERVGTVVTDVPRLAQSIRGAFHGDGLALRALRAAATMR